MNAPAPDHEITLDDKYALQSGRAFMTGTQALGRLPMLQRVRDLAAGLNTAGFISGYRGSPVGGFDQALWKARKFLDEHHVKFQPGVNEDLAATSIWGTQQVNLYPDAKYDGVFAMWYGKGPGVDRCGDVFKHANSAGTSQHGGVLVLAGDDHAAKSSTLAHQSEHIFKACCIPVLNPASVQEYLDLGLHGIAMSRFSGCWVAFKCVTDVIESGAVVEIDPQRVSIVMPPDFAMPPGGLNIRWPDAFLEQEARLLDYKVYAALAYCRANRLDRIVWDNPKARFGIVTTGKSFGDTLQALADLGIDERVAARGREPTAVLLLGLPAQHFDPGSRGQPRHGRHRLPLHGGVDGPQHFDVHAHGRRRRALDRAGAVHRVPARVRQPRRRHLLSLGAARDPRRGRSRRQHDLQDPLQRRGGHDRRPALRRSARPGDDLAPDRRRGRATDRRRRGREGIVAGETRLGPRNDGPAARGPRRGAARAAREERRFGDHLRADLRHREAPAQKAQGVSRSRQARGHQRDGL